MSLERRPWPNGLGFDLCEAEEERVSCFTAGHWLQLALLERDGSVCGFRSVAFLDLDRGTLENGLELDPESLSNETLLDLVREHGETLED